ncbi:hypothetical protein HID58_047083, partial [Brassica napus]
FSYVDRIQSRWRITDSKAERSFGGGGAEAPCDASCASTVFQRVRLGKAVVDSVENAVPFLLSLIMYLLPIASAYLPSCEKHGLRLSELLFCWQPDKENQLLI